MSALMQKGKNGVKLDRRIGEKNYIIYVVFKFWEYGVISKDWE